MATEHRGPCLFPVRPARVRLSKVVRAILVPGLGLPPRPDGAKATKRYHLSDRDTCTGPGSRNRSGPDRRLVLGFSWSLNCGSFAWALTKAAHAAERHWLCVNSQGGRPARFAHRRVSESPPTVTDPLRPLSTQSRARETRKRGGPAPLKPKTRRLRRASAVRPPATRPPRPRAAAALRGPPARTHTKSREARRGDGPRRLSLIHI